MTWRWRDRPWAAGGPLALAVAFKLFLWPFVVWLAATRRYRAAIIAAALATTYTLVAWAAIGFEGLRLIRSSHAACPRSSGFAATHL